MSDNKPIDVKIEATAKAEVTADLTNFVDESVVPSTKKLGDTVAALLEHIFGDYILSGKKKEIQRHHELECFIKSLEDKKLEIPKVNLQEPKLSIVGPALEASKYYFEEPELREMFAKLVSSSLDDRKNNLLHESFTEIIKQLSTIDAKHLKQISTNEVNPFIKVRHNLSGEITGIDYIKLFYRSNFLDDSMYELTASSISNLSRLGLIEYFDDRYYSNDFVYKDLESSPVIVDALNPIDSDDIHAVVKKGYIDITPFGDSFCKSLL